MFSSCRDLEMCALRFIWGRCGFLPGWVVLLRLILLEYHIIPTRCFELQRRVWGRLWISSLRTQAAQLASSGPLQTEEGAEGSAAGEGFFGLTQRAWRWRCPSRRENRGRRGRKRKARMRVKSWRRARVAAGRSGRSRLVFYICVCVCVWK